MKILNLGALALTLGLATQNKAASAFSLPDLSFNISISDFAVNAAEAGKYIANQATNALQDIKWENITAPILQGATTAFEAAKDVVESTAQGVQNTTWQDAVELLKNGSTLATEAAKQGYDEAFDRLQDVKWDELPEEVKRYILENPLSAAELALFLTSLACPGLSLTPLLRAAGFSRLGPVANTFASWFQRTYGTTWLFRGFQSTPMGGYGAPVVKGVWRGFHVVGAGIAHLARRNATESG